MVNRLKLSFKLEEKMLQLERHSGDEGILLFLGEDSLDDTDL